MLLFSALVLVGCAKVDSMKHAQYLYQKGWEVASFEDYVAIELILSEEMLMSYEANGITFFRDVEGENVTQYVYYLKEKDHEGNPLEAVIYEKEGHIIGGVGLLSGWSPSVFNLDDKKRLLIENQIQE